MDNLKCFTIVNYDSNVVDLVLKPQQPIFIVSKIVHQDLPTIELG